MVRVLKGTDRKSLGWRVGGREGFSQNDSSANSKEDREAVWKLEGSAHSPSGIHETTK